MMQKNIIRHIFVVFIILVFIILYVITFNTFSIGKRFVHEIGLTKISPYKNAVKDMGEPINQGFNDEYNEYNVDYEGVRLSFRYNKNNEPQCFIRIDITGDQYKVGYTTVGSNINVLKKLYYFKKKVKDLPENEFGIIENDLWTVFKYNKNNIVEQIIVYYGP